MTINIRQVDIIRSNLAFICWVLFNKTYGKNRLCVSIISRHEIMKSLTFGKPSIYHYFTSEVYFEHVRIEIIERI